LSSFIGELRHSGDGDPENLFKVTDVVSGDSVAPPVSETGCAMQMPA
jgi:branched-chain amino acid transport system substrate-binding protein